jgi:protein arginine kinase activator
MRCDQCGGEPAEIQLTRVEDDEMRVLHLCQSCAAEQGVETSVLASAPLADFVAQIGKGMTEAGTPAGGCPSCGLTPPQLRQVGRLGCADCYGHYEQHLRNLLRRLHGGTQHVGKVAEQPDSGEVDRKARMQSLRRSLQRAVDAEDFEHAAVLRDQIRRLDPAG